MLSSYDLFNLVEPLSFAPIMLSPTGKPINRDNQADDGVLNPGISKQHCFLDYVTSGNLRLHGHDERERVHYESEERPGQRDNIRK